jgi:hypothetical protein
MLNVLNHFLYFRSVICDNILDKIPDRDREFPLYPKGREVLFWAALDSYAIS